MDATEYTAKALGAALQDAAQRGVESGVAGTAVDNTAPGIALTVLMDRGLRERSIVFPHVMAKKQAEAAVDIAEASRVCRVLGLDKPRRGRYVRHLNLGGDTYVVEVEKGPFGDRARWTVIYAGEDVHTFYPSLDVALLAAIELRATGREQGAYAYAAKILDVTLPD